MTQTARLVILATSLIVALACAVIVSGVMASTSVSVLVRRQETADLDVWIRKTCVQPRYSGLEECQARRRLDQATTDEREAALQAKREIAQADRETAVANRRIADLKRQEAGLISRIDARDDASAR